MDELQNEIEPTGEELDQVVEFWGDGLTIKQQRFVEEYLGCWNGTEAAVRAGYTENRNTAGVIAHKLLRSSRIQAVLKQRLASLTMTAEEAAKRFSDIASSRLNDYIKIKEVERPTTIKKPLAETIAALQAEMDFEERYAQRAKLSGKELTAHKKDQDRRERQIIRLQLELEDNPQATRDAPGPLETVEEWEIDMIALAKEKEKGWIKSLSFGEHGPKVELYGADSALDKLLAFHGKYINKHEHTGANGGPMQVEDLSNLTDEQLRNQVAALEAAIRTQEAPASPQ